MASIVYIDEELPEITVHEIVSGDEDINVDKDKIGINIHSTDELFDQLMILLQKLKDTSSIPIRRKAHGFLDIHTELFKPEVPVAMTIVPVVTAQRHDVADEQEEFFIKYDEASKIDNYFLRRDEMHKVFFNYESTNTTDPPQWIVSGEVDIDTDDRVKLLGTKDNLSVNIRSIKTYQGISPFNVRFEKLSLKDKLESTRQPWKEIPVTVDTNEQFKDMMNELFYPELDEYAKKLEDITDLYGLWKHFMLYGIDLDDYSEDDWEALLDHLQELRNKDKDIFEFLKPFEFTPQPVVLKDIGGYAFYKIQKEIVQRLLPILATLQGNLLNLYRTFLDATPMVRLDTSKLPSKMYDLAMKIYEQSSDLTQVVDLFKTMILGERLKELDQWMKVVQQWNIDALEDKVEAEVLKYEQTQRSILDEVHFPLTSLSAEIKHIKRGTVIATYINEDEHTADDVFETTNDFMIERDDPDELTVPVYDTILPIDISSLEEGQKEIQEIALRMIVEIQAASGIALDFTTIYNKMPIQLRLSKYTQIKEQFPELKEDICYMLSKADINQLDTIIAATLPSTMYQVARQTLLKIHQDYRQDLFNYYTLFIALWVCDLHNQVLNRTLKFDLWKGSLNCIQVWSPYGMPLEGMKMKKEGIINYLICIIHDLTFTTGTQWNIHALSITREDLLQRWVSLFETDLQDVVVELQERFKSFEKETVNRGLLEKGEDIKKQIINTVEQRNKNRYLSDYLLFLKNLPSVLIQSSIAKKIHLGCCLQALNEKYRSDYDWSALVKEAYKIKKLYATQRYGVDKRPVLVKIIKDLEAYEQKELENPFKYIQYEQKESIVVNTLYESFQPYMPVNDYVLLNAGIRNLIPTIDKYFSIYRYTLKVPEAFEDAIRNKLTLGDLFQLYRKIMQVQYKTISITTQEQLYLKEQIVQSEAIYTIVSSIQGYFNEVQEQTMTYILHYFIIRQLCFPAKPEFAQTNILTLIDTTVEADLVKNYTAKIFTFVNEWINAKLFNTQINFIDYIAKMREQENLGKLNLIDQMTPEQRKQYVEAKKLGITELQDFLEKFKEQQYERRGAEEVDDAYERDGEEEYYPKHGENDDESNPDAFNDDEF